MRAHKRQVIQLVNKKHNGKTSTSLSTEVVEPFTWSWFGLKLVEGVVSGIGAYGITEFIKANFNRADDYSDLFRAAITEICNTLKEAIDNAFLNEYTSDSESVRQQIRDYGDHGDPEILIETLSKTYDLVNRFDSYGAKGFGGLTLASNLHLLTLRSLSEVPGKEKYKITLEKTCKEYADMLNESAEEYIGVFKENLKKNVQCVFLPGLPDPFSHRRPPKFIYYNTISHERLEFPRNEEHLCHEKVNSFIEQSVAENKYYQDAKEIIKKYSELDIPEV